MNEQKRPQLNNDDLYDLLSAYLDDAVTEPERAQVEQAVAKSPETAAELESLRQTVALLAELPPMPAPRPFTLSAADVGKVAPARKKSWLPLPGWLGGLAAAAGALLCVLAAGGYLLVGPMGMSGSAPAEVAMQRESAAPAAEANMATAGEAESADSASAEMAAGAVAPVEESAPAEPQEAPMMMVAEATSLPRALPDTEAATPQETPMMAVEATSVPQELPATVVQEKAAAAEAIPPAVASAEESAAAEAEQTLDYAEEPAGDEAMLAAPAEDDATRGIAAEEAAPAPEMAAPVQKEAGGAAAAPPQSDTDAVTVETAPAEESVKEGEAPAVEVLSATAAPEQNNLADQAVPQLMVSPSATTPIATASPTTTPAQRSLISRAMVTVLAVGVVLALAAVGLWLLLRRKSGDKG